LEVGSWKKRTGLFDRLARSRCAMRAAAVRRHNFEGASAGSSPRLCADVRTFRLWGPKQRAERSCARSFSFAT